MDLKMMINNKLIQNKISINYFKLFNVHAESGEIEKVVYYQHTLIILSVIQKNYYELE